MVSGSIHLTKAKQEAATKAIETQLPMFKAPMTWASLASLLFILTSMVPIKEIIIPTPAIDIGNKIGPIPPKASEILPPISLIT